jgi:hypothetical protein
MEINDVHIVRLAFLSTGSEKLSNLSVLWQDSGLYYQRTLPGPITLWTYLKSDRPTKPGKGKDSPSIGAHHSPHANAGHKAEEAHSTEGSQMGENVNNSEQGMTGKLGKDVHDTNDSLAGQGHSDHDMAGQHQHGGGERPIFDTITVAPAVSSATLPENSSFTAQM